jgi:hypothetical protein
VRKALGRFLMSSCRPVRIALRRPGEGCLSHAGPVVFSACLLSTGKLDEDGCAWLRNIRVAQSKSEQAGAPEKFLKTLVGAIAIKDRVDGEVSHPDGVIAIRGLEPFECVFFAVQRCVDLSQPVW